MFFEKFHKSKDKICPWPLCKGILNLKHAYIGVDVDFWRSLAGEANELTGVELADDHLPRLLDGAERLRRALVITVFHRLDLSEDFVGYSAHLHEK